jgi:SAM-dependent methyltransferase
MSNTVLYDWPELYDLVMPANPMAQAFFLNEACRRGGAVLELACGSGRFTIPLARSGIEVIGGDISAAMLRRGREQSAAAGAHVSFIQMDMKDFDLGGRRFGLILIAANSILHLHDIDDFRRCFHAVARHLAPGGAFVFDAFVPSMQILARKPAERHLVGHFTHDRMGQVKLEETTDYDAASQVNRGTWYWSTSSELDMLVMPVHLRQLFPQELPLLLQSGGFRLAARYGDFDRRPFDAQSRRQVCVCEVT